MMDNVSADQVRQAVQENKIGRWRLRECGFCFVPLFYFFENGEAFYQPNCDCVTYTTTPEPRTFESIAEIFNMQNPEVRNRMWGEFVASGVTQ